MTKRPQMRTNRRLDFGGGAESEQLPLLERSRDCALADLFESSCYGCQRGR